MKNFRKSNLHSKVVAGLMISFIGLSLNIGGKVSAIPPKLRLAQHPIQQNSIEENIAKVLEESGVLKIEIPSPKPLIFQHFDSVKPLPFCSKEDLLEMLPAKFEKFLYGYQSVYKELFRLNNNNQMDKSLNLHTFLSYCEQSVRYAAKEDIYDSVQNHANSVATNLVPFVNWQTAWRNAFVFSWRPDGEAYEKVKNYEKGYFVNLVNILNYINPMMQPHENPQNQ